MVAAGEPLLFNPIAPGYAENPYEQLAALREHDPVHESPLGIWVLFAYADVFRVLRDATLSVEEDNIADFDTERRETFDRIAAEYGGRERSGGDRAILNIDPPDHTRIRRLVAKAFTPRMIERLRPRVQALTDEALDRADPSQPWDIVSELAFPLPFQVISEMLGMPEADRDQVREWSHTLTATLDPIVSEAQMRAAFEASDSMAAHTAEVLEWKRSHPADDVLTALLNAEEDGDTLSQDELLDQVILIYIAGHETTVNLIGNGTLALLRNRGQLERWRDDPSLDASAIDELLRYDPPVQLSRRITLEEVEIGGRTVPPNAVLMTSLASANRDAAHWGPTADELDLGREGAGQHVSFGSGVHYCLGASLARLEGQVAIGTVIRRFPELDPAGEPVHNGRITLRGLDALPLTLAG